jgi:hypothetical protein
MAKLLTPLLARAFVHTMHSKTTISKYHLMNMNSDLPWPRTVCNKYWPSFYNAVNTYEEAAVSQLKRDQLCRRCLGAMQVSDEEIA